MSGRPSSAEPSALSAAPGDPVFLRRASGGVTIQLRVQPRARRVTLDCTAEGGLKAAVTAAPEDGKANDAVVALLAQAWRLPKSTIEIVRGGTAREKTLSITGEPAALAERISAWISEWVRKNG
jgi:uncharacterized protein (TIGR00251 family)